MSYSNSWSPGLSQAHCASTTTAKVIRDQDFMRTGIRGRAREVSAARLELLLESPVELAEHVCVELENVIQRVKVQVRACVECVEACDNGLHRLVCSLLTRLSPRDVQGLTMSNGWGGNGEISLGDFLKRHLD